MTKNCTLSKSPERRSGDPPPNLAHPQASVCAPHRNYTLVKRSFAPTSPILRRTRAVSPEKESTKASFRRGGTGTHRALGAKCLINVGPRLRILDGASLTPHTQSLASRRNLMRSPPVCRTDISPPQVGTAKPDGCQATDDDESGADPA